MKKYLIIITSFIILINIYVFAKDPSPEVVAKAQEIIKTIEQVDIEKLKELVKDREALNVVVKDKYSDSNTPLTYAVIFYDKANKDKDGKKRIEMINILLEAGAKVDFTNHLKQTPLIKASYDGNIDIVNLLLKSGAKVNASDEIGITALMKAVQYMNADIVEVLIQNKADIKKRDNINVKKEKGKGDSAIFFCNSVYASPLKKFNTACFDLLLAHGADPIAETGGMGNSFFEMTLIQLRSSLTSRYVSKDEARIKYLEELLIKSASHILKNKPNYLASGKPKQTMLMILAEYSPYVSTENLESILDEAARSKADFSLKSAEKKTAFEYLPAIYKGKEIEEQINNMKLIQVYKLFSKYNTMSGRPYKNADKVIEEKMKH